MTVIQAICNYTNMYLNDHLFSCVFCLTSIKPTHGIYIHSNQSDYRGGVVEVEVAKYEN